MADAPGEHRRKVHHLHAGAAHDAVHGRERAGSIADDAGAALESCALSAEDMGAAASEAPLGATFGLCILV